jgi:hypothetical protein
LPGIHGCSAYTPVALKRVGRDVAVQLFLAGYEYGLRPEHADRWAALYGPGVTAIPVMAFGAQLVDPREPVLDPSEHDAWAWVTYEEARARLDWPIERDALPGRRAALAELARRIPQIVN